MLNPASKSDEDSPGTGPNYGYGKGNGNGYGYYGQMATAANENALPTIDFYGAIFRRKFVVILLSLFGTGIGYLLYAQATPIYASSLRLMVWVQAPPTIVNGEMVSQTVSMSKQQNLIASTLVISNAVRVGELEQRETFKGSPAAAGALKKMLRIVPVDRNADALDLTLTGTVAGDLPPMLEEIVKSYINIIEEDTVAAGKESVALIERLQQRLEEDQKQDQTKYYELLKKLNLTAENDSGKWVNPYSNDIQQLKSERDSHAKSLDELDQKLKTLRSALESSNENHPIRQLAAIEARKVFLISEEKSEISLAAENGIAEDRTTLRRLQNRFDVIDGKIFELETQRDDLLRQFGPRHQSITATDSSLQSYSSKRREIEGEIERVNQAISAKLESVKKFTGVRSDSKDKDNDLLKLYGIKLVSEQTEKKKQFEKVTADYAKLEESSKMISADMAEVNMLKSQINERRDAVAKILDKLSAINVLSNNYTTTKVRVIDPASGASKVAPKLTSYLAFGTIAAALLGIGLAILIDQSDLSYRTPLDIQHSLAVPVICKIPKIKAKKVSSDQIGSPTLVTAFNPQSPAAETFRAARTSLLFTAHQNNFKVFLFTSPTPGDGKSTTSSNLAISLAQAKKRVVLVDADFRRPRVQQNFGVQIDPGCVEVLSGAKTLDEAIRPCEFQPNLFLLTTGGRPKDAGELIASNEFAEMINQLREKFDFVIIDSPPILPVADSTSLASVVDGIYLVLRIRRGVMLAATKAKERLDMVQGKVLGVIVNGMDQNTHYNEYGTYYKGGYYTGYSKNYDSQNSSYTEKNEKEGKKTAKA